MRYFKQAILAIAATVILSGCGDGITDQDKAFIATLKQHLKTKGDVVKVSDVHPGDWEKVCINPLSSYSNIEVKNVKGVGFRSNGREIINGANTYADDNVWGIYFMYPEDKAEYYRIPIHEMQGSWKGNEACVPTHSAYLEVRGDYDHRTMTSNKSDIPPSYIEVILLEKEN